MKKTVALTGASGNMGRETLKELAQSQFVGKIKVLLYDGAREKGRARRLARLCRAYGGKVEIIRGDLADKEACAALISGVDYILNLAAVIPPKSDRFPELAEKCNDTGVKNLVELIENAPKQPKFVHISTVALYGHRNHIHPWGRVGDPLMPSPFDIYAATKLKGERRVLDSSIENWAVLRQTAMLYDSMLRDNIGDGLMFHTPYNVPLEWVTARDSGLLLKKLVEKDAQNQLPDGFWKKVYNIGGGRSQRCTGYETFDCGFKIIGGSTEKFMKPDWNAPRNFHGLWFYDGSVLNDILEFQRDDFCGYWQHILKTHRYYKLAALFPPKLISRAVIGRLLKNYNAPKLWINKNDGARVKAFFGCGQSACELPQRWSEFPLFAKGAAGGETVDYDAVRDEKYAKQNGYLLDHGYDENKPDAELDIEDMKRAAQFRGGECLSCEMKKGDLYAPLKWRCHDGHEFYASPYTVVKAGHWCPDCCQPQPWDYDRLSKRMPFFAQVWYDSHEKDENTKYYFDQNYCAKCEIQND
jgi:nucleoside-diphosphate-sugar epimerase